MTSPNQDLAKERIDRYHSLRTLQEQAHWQYNKFEHLMIDHHVSKTPHLLRTIKQIKIQEEYNQAKNDLEVVDYLLQHL